MTNKLWVGISALALATVPALASASVVGFLGNFDVILHRASKAFKEVWPP